MLVKQQSTLVCRLTVHELINGVIRELPPSSGVLKEYAGVIFGNATCKLVDVNLLSSESHNRQNLESTYQGQILTTEHCSLSQTLEGSQGKQIKTSQNDEKSSKLLNSYQGCAKTSFCKPLRKLVSNDQKLKINASRLYSKGKKPLVEDEEIHLQKEGIKFVKRQQLKNLIRHRTYGKEFNQQSSHLQNNRNSSVIKEKLSHSFAENQIGFPSGQDYNKSTIIGSRENEGNSMECWQEKSIKSISVVNGDEVSPKSRIQRVTRNRISINQKQQENNLKFEGGPTKRASLSSFVNLDEYYSQKNRRMRYPERHQSMLSKRSSAFAGNPQKEFKRNQNLIHTTVQPLNNQSEILARSVNITPETQNFGNSRGLYEGQENCISNSQQYMQSQARIFKEDPEDAVIQKLRQRKQKFCRKDINFFGDSYETTKRSSNIPVQKGSSSGQNHSAMPVFDYSAEMIPAVKYDSMKLQHHYQEMDFSVNQIQEAELKKKKERNAYRFKKAINLKIVDHFKFLPHPNFKHEPLKEREGGTQMLECAAYSLKKGVELLKRDASNSQNAHNDTPANDQKPPKTAFEFLYNDSSAENQLKYSDFVKYKKASQSSTSLHTAGKHGSSRKKLFDEHPGVKGPSGLVNAQVLNPHKKVLDDRSNKVFKTENAKAVAMLLQAAGIENKSLGEQTDTPLDQFENRGSRNEGHGGLVKKFNSEKKKVVRIM